jgi:transcription elongation factor Elf1
MKPWWEDKRFQCPHCGTLVVLGIASVNKAAGTYDFVAVCRKCDRFFDEQEWRHRHGGVSRYWNVDF